MTSLILAPWERTHNWRVSSSQENSSVHSISWNLEMVPFLFQVCNIYSRPYVFARPLGSQDEGNWLVKLGNRINRLICRNI